MSTLSVKKISDDTYTLSRFGAGRPVDMYVYRFFLGTRMFRLDHFFLPTPLTKEGVPVALKPLALDESKPIIGYVASDSNVYVGHLERIGSIPVECQFLTRKTAIPVVMKNLMPDEGRLLHRARWGWTYLKKYEPSVLDHGTGIEYTVHNMSDVARVLRTKGYK